VLRAVLKRVLELRDFLGDVIDHRLLLAQRFEIDSHVVQQLRDGVRLRLDFVTSLRRGIVATIRFVVSAIRDSQLVDPRFEGGHLGPAAVDVREIGLAPRAIWWTCSTSL